MCWLTPYDCDRPVWFDCITTQDFSSKDTWNSRRLDLHKWKDMGLHWDCHIQPHLHYHADRMSQNYTASSNHKNPWLDVPWISSSLAVSRFTKLTEYECQPQNLPADPVYHPKDPVLPNLPLGSTPLILPNKFEALRTTTTWNYKHSTPSYYTTNKRLSLSAGPCYFAQSSDINGTRLDRNLGA